MVQKFGLAALVILYFAYNGEIAVRKKQINKIMFFIVVDLAIKLNF